MRTAFTVAGSVTTRKMNSRLIVLVALCLFVFLYVPRERNGIKRAENEYLDAFAFMLNPDTSLRNNFGVLFRKALQNSKERKGNFLEIGGGSGKFFDHNMNSFGSWISTYVIIEPYPNDEFSRAVQSWKHKVQHVMRGDANITVIHDFSTNNDVIDAFPDNYFDFVYIDGDHSYKGAKSDLRNYYPKVRRGGVIAGHDYCCSYKEWKEILHAPWCGKYIYPHSTSTESKDGKEKASWCGIYKGAEEFAKENNFYWFYTLEGRQGRNNAGRDNPSYFTFKQS